MRYHNITKEDMLNGDGLRVVLWLAGCSHGCKGCQNPITWDPKGGLEFDQDAKEEIYDQLNKSYISGITFSGGDPLFLDNRVELTEFIKDLKNRYPKKTIWLYTGFLWEEIKDLELISYVDVLVDGRFILEEKDVSLKWKGSTNQRVINVKKTSETGELILHA